MAQVTVTNPNTGQNKLVRVLMDPGSEVNLISKTLVEFLDLPKRQRSRPVRVKTVNNMTTKLMDQADFIIHHRTNDTVEMPVSAVIMPDQKWTVKLAAQLPTWVTENQKLLVDPEFVTSKGNPLPFDIILDIADSFVAFLDTIYKQGKFGVKQTMFGIRENYGRPVTTCDAS